MSMLVRRVESDFDDWRVSTDFIAYISSLFGLFTSVQGVPVRKARTLSVLIGRREQFVGATCLSH